MSIKDLKIKNLFLLVLVMLVLAIIGLIAKTMGSGTGDLGTRVVNTAEAFGVGVDAECSEGSGEGSSSTDCCW
jgi:hypothetical protein